MTRERRFSVEASFPTIVVVACCIVLISAVTCGPEKAHASEPDDRKPVVERPSERRIQDWFDFRIPLDTPEWRRSLRIKRRSTAGYEAARGIRRPVARTRGDRSRR